MPALDLYRALGGRDMCLELAESFYARVKRDPLLRPLFPGKSIKCAIEAFAAFLAQFLGGPSEDAQERWWLSLRESHRRFQIGPRERQAWLRHMRDALADLPVDETMRLALSGLFERSSAYIVNSGPAIAEPPRDPSPHPIHREIAQRWTEQRALDDLVAAIGAGDPRRALELAVSPVLTARFARDRAVFSHVLALMIAAGHEALIEFAEQQLLADPPLASVPNRYGRTLLHDAAAWKNLRLVGLLLRLGADPNGGVHPPLYCVANEIPMPGGGDVVRALVRAGARVNEPSGPKRCTALHMAARRGNVEVAVALLDCSADINARDSAGVTPVQRAKNCRKPAVAALLASRGATRPNPLPSLGVS